MRWYTKVAAAALAALLQACATGPVVAPETPVPVEVREPVTILISIDGFRPDYLDREITPNLSAMAADGVRAAMRPSFPSKTFPNHYAIVTGLRPDRNGITANKMEDPAKPGVTFTMATLDRFWWDAAEPVWVTAEQAGIRTGTMFWPGSNAKVHGTYPGVWQQFNQDVTGEQRVDAVIDWMRRPADRRPKLVTLYFDTVDTAGHDFGPFAPETDKAVGEVDAEIGRLHRELDALGQPVNYVIVSDHGMAPMSPDREVKLYEIVPADVGRNFEDGPYATYYPVEGKQAELEKLLLGKHDHYECWRKGEMPARFHYGANPRIPPIFCLGETSWILRGKPANPDWAPDYGNHGWDNDAPEMRATFLAEGPAFRAGKTLPVFDNVDVYALLRDLIGLPPAAGVDGTDAVFAPVMAE